MKIMPIWVTITTHDGELIDRIDISETDLRKPVAAQDFVLEVQASKEKAIHAVSCHDK